MILFDYKRHTVVEDKLLSKIGSQNRFVRKTINLVLGSSQTGTHSSLVSIINQERGREFVTICEFVTTSRVC